MMKLLSVIVKPHVVPRLMDCLDSLPIRAVQIKEVKGYGRQKNYLDEYLGSEYSAAYIPKVLIEILLHDADAEEVIAQVVETARTGRMGDGKIFVIEGDADELQSTVTVEMPSAS